MNIDYTVTALMFPAIPLIMGVYSNRFHTLSSLIRKIHDEYVFEKHTPPEWKDQLINLEKRIGVLNLIDVDLSPIISSSFISWYP